MQFHVLHVKEGDASRDFGAILEHVQAGIDVVIERGAEPLAVITSARGARRTISDCIAIAESLQSAGTEPAVLDSDFAADVEDIVANRKVRN